MINIDQKHLKIIQDILAKYDYAFYLFGSRSTNKATAFSDLDLFYTDDIPPKLIIKLEEEFEESDLPYKVDIINYNKCDEEFKKIIRQNYVCIKPPSSLIPPF